MTWSNYFGLWWIPRSKSLGGIIWYSVICTWLQCCGKWKPTQTRKIETSSHAWNEYHCEGIERFAAKSQGKGTGERPSPLSGAKKITPGISCPLLHRYSTRIIAWSVVFQFFQGFQDALAASSGPQFLCLIWGSGGLMDHKNRDHLQSFFSYTWNSDDERS